MISQTPDLLSENDAATPSRDFIRAISEFLDTNPDDLLLELGYYEREDADVSSENGAVS